MKTLYEMSNEELLNELLVYIVMQEPKDMDHEMFYNFKREILWRIEGKA